MAIGTTLRSDHSVTRLRVLGALPIVVAVIALIASLMHGAPSRAAGVSTGDGAWTWQNPTPQGNDLHDVRFVDAAIGWAVGKGGVVMRTTDGGVSWTIQNSGTNVSLLGLAARDASTAIAVGDRGTIIKTVDGGATWALRPAPGPNLLIAVDYATASTLHAVGLDGTFLTSEDSGDTWLRTTPLGPVGLRDVQFLDASTGYVLGVAATIYLTRDAGATWRQLATPSGFSLRAFRFRDAQLGIAVGDGGALLKTQNGGETWQTVPSPTAADLYSVAFGEGNSVHAVGDGGTIVKSVDGGQTWAQLPAPRPAAAKVVRVVFPGGAQAQRGYAVGFNGTLLRTVDGGVSWESLSRSPRGTLRALTFVTSDTVVAVGERGTIAKSADRGMTWREVRSGTGRDLNAVQFFTRQVGFAVGDGGVILRTDDTGETWRQVRSPVGVNLRAIALSGNPDTGKLDVGLIAGDTNFILRSTDEGTSWFESRLPGGNDQPYAVAFPEPRVGYVGGRTTIWQTTDFGRTWRVAAGGAATPRDPLAFAFPTVNRGYAVGQMGQIFRTNDGGTTWQRLTSGTTRQLNGVTFRDETTGYAVGDEGTILVTNNGGDTWRPVNSGTHLSLRSVRFLTGGDASSTIGIAVGEGGIVLKTASAGLPTRDLPPAVAAIFPTDNQTNVVDERIRVSFTKDIAFSAADYAEGGRFQLRDVAGRFVPATASYDPNSAEVMVRPLQPLTPGGTYTFAIAGGENGLADLDGRRMVFPFRSTFRTACETAPAGGFGKLFGLDTQVRDRIGCPTNTEQPLVATEQVFERGQMLLRRDSKQILVSFFDDGHWAAYPDTFREGDSLSRSRAPEGLLVPDRNFGKVWRENAALRDRLGWAVGPERGFDGVAQEFGGGSMVWTGTGQWLVRVYFNDGATLVTVDPNAPPETSTLPAGFLEQATASFDCRFTSVSRGCLEFEDGFIWSVSDAIGGKEERGTWEGKRIVAYVGGKATYSHILGTRFVRIEAKAAPTPAATPTAAR